MSVIVKEEELTKEHKKLIVKFLFITAETPGNRNFATSSVSIKHFDFKNGLVYLPYFFANKLLGENRNFKKEYPSVRFDFNGKLRDDQLLIVAEAAEKLQTDGVVTLGLYTGFGKTITATYMAAGCNLLTVITFTTQILLKSWTSTLKEFTNAIPWIIGENKPDNYNIILSMNGRIHDIPQEIKDQVGLLIIDECHEFCSPERAKLFLEFQPKYCIALSATPEKEDGTYAIMDSVCGKNIIYRISTKPFIVHKYCSGISVAIEPKKDGSADWSKLVKALCESELRNKQILHLVNTHKDHKILIITHLVDHARVLVKLLQDVGEKVDMMAGNKKSYNDSRVLIGTISKIGTGFDEKTVCDDFNGVRINLLIQTASMKSRTRINQVTGRVFRADYPEVIHFVDNVSIIKSHWYVARKWYLSRNATLKDLDVMEIVEKNPVTEIV